MMINNFAKRLSKDVILNIGASLISTGVMQLAVYPFLAWRFSEAKYGVILTTMGILNVLVSVFGNTVNNVRLLQNSFYEEKKVYGDFNAIILLFAILSSIIAFVSTNFFMRLDMLECLMAMTFCAIGVWNSYNCADFRLHLNFKRIMVFNIVGAIGYLVGLLFSIRIAFWVFPFLTSQVFQFFYLLKFSGLYKEAFGKTIFLCTTLKKVFILMITTLSGSLMVYLDRFLIYPFLGGESVSVYGVASFFGKALSIVMTPIAGVLLGYYAQKGFQMTKKLFRKTNMISLLMGLAFIMVSLFIAPFFTSLLYPKVFVNAKPYIFIANLAATIGVVSNMTQVAVLKFAPTWLQIVKEVIYGMTYLIVGMLTIDRFGLWGFCIAAVVSNMAKLISLYIIGDYYIGKSMSYE